MRYRERLLPNVPYASGLVVQKETFLDDPNPLRRDEWKPASHSRSKVLSVVPQGNIRRHVQFTPGGWGWDFGVAQGPAAAFTSYVGPSNEIGWWEERLVEDGVALPTIDLASMRVERSRSSCNLAETIATFKDTLSLFSRPWHFVNHLKKVRAYGRGGTLRNAKDAIDRAADTWLQGTYGYLPFLADLAELREICSDPIGVLRNRLQPEMQKVIQSTSREFESQAPQSPQFGQGFIHQKSTVSIKRVAQITWVMNPSWASMSVANQLASYMGLYDLGRLALELTPYSFVLEWFTNLGRRCAEADALNGPYAMDIGSVTVGVQTKRTLERTGHCPVSHREIPDFTYTMYFDGFPKEVTEELHYVRESLGTGEQLDQVFFCNGLSAYRTATGLALLVGPATSFFKHLTKGK